MIVRKQARDLVPGDKVWDVDRDLVHEVLSVAHSPGEINLTKIIFANPIPDGLGADKRGALIPCNIEVRLVKD
jgi:hypothetical protein